jgi:hypothetical protein
MPAGTDFGLTDLDVMVRAIRLVSHEVLFILPLFHRAGNYYNWNIWEDQTGEELA